MNRNAVPYHSPGSRSHPGATGMPLTHENPEGIPDSMQPLRGWNLQGDVFFPGWLRDPGLCSGTPLAFFSHPRTGPKTSHKTGSEGIRECLNCSNGSSKESMGKTRMSFSLFNPDTHLKKSPSPFPLPLEREFFSPLLSGHTPPLPETSAFFSLSRGRGKGEGPFSRHGGGTEQRSETGPRKTYGLQTFRMLQVALYHALGNLPESEFTHEFF